MFRGAETLSVERCRRPSPDASCPCTAMSSTGGRTDHGSGAAQRVRTRDAVAVMPATGRALGQRAAIPPPGGGPDADRVASATAAERPYEFAFIGCPSGSPMRPLALPLGD